MSAAPEWTRSEQSLDEAKGFLRQGGTVDFFEMIARNILQTQPIDLPAYCLGLVDNILEGVEIAVNADFQPKKVESNAYMREKNVSEFLDHWVLALLQDRPASDAERVAFHKRYLTELVKGSS